MESVLYSDVQEKTVIVIHFKSKRNSMVVCKDFVFTDRILEVFSSKFPSHAKHWPREKIYSIEVIERS